MPRTCGRRPSQRLRPAFPSRVFSCEMLPTWPIVGEADHPDAALLARRQLHLGVVAFLRHQLRRGTRAADELSAAPLGELDVVDRRAERDVLQRSELPGLISAPGPATTVSPTFSPTGDRM